MQPRQMPAFAIHRLFGRLKRRAIGVALLTLFTAIAIYYFTVAGTLMLDSAFGTLSAHLIVGAIYLTAALTVLIVLWATRLKPRIENHAAALVSPRDMQMAALIEAAMLGYVIARKSSNRNP